MATTRVLFIGGENDGERLLVSGLPLYFEVPISGYVRNQQRVERYRLGTFILGGARVVAYVEEGVTMRDATKKIEEYLPATEQ